MVTAAWREKLRWWNEAKRRMRLPFWNAGYRIAGSIDGYPFPPSNLLNLVIGTQEVAWYQTGGMFNHQAFTSFLYRNNVPVGELKRILDFGCGCGRILRWWASIKDTCEIWGCDYNPALIAWCRKALSDVAQFAVNESDPPLDFRDGFFELVYSYSVFTHFSAGRQGPWIAELSRILRPNGLLLITVHGRRCAVTHGLNPDALKTLDETGIFVREEQASGRNECRAYLAETFLRLRAADAGLEMVDFLHGGTKDCTEQDMYLFRKRTVAL
jgi:SAM-dependent methyltransferase